MTFAEVAAELSRATGRGIEYVDIPHEAFVAEVTASGAPQEVAWMLEDLFSTVLDGRNAHLADGRCGAEVMTSGPSHACPDHVAIEQTPRQGDGFD